jgi:hypothetical protein
MPTKKNTGMNTTKNMVIQVKTDEMRGEIFLEKKLNTGLKIPADTMPSKIVAKNGAINLPMSKMAMQNSARKKKKTAR